MNTKNFFSVRYLVPAGICLLVVLSIIYIYFFCAMSKDGESHIIYIDNDDNVDSVMAKLEPMSSKTGMVGFATLSRHVNYHEKVKPGRYEMEKYNGAFVLIRKLLQGRQAPINLVVPSVRTTQDLASSISKKLVIDSTAIANVLTDEILLKKYGYTKETIIAMFIPNTYEVYWNISAEKLLERMNEENKKFWTEERINKAKDQNLTPVEVATLASIIDEETANDAERPNVAGMYLNRLNTNMPLQADPTIKFALQDFTLKRIYNKMLYVKSPYNTYINTGLPPGPIRVATISSIDAVLNPVKHDFLYMCANPDFSGTHIFAVTYEEHLKNAAAYAKALNDRNIQ